MHVIGELQIRHSENRAPIEKAFMIFYAIIDLIQLTSILVFAAQLTRAFPNTFTGAEFWDSADYNLSLLLQYKTDNCTYSVDDATTEAATGFSNIYAEFSSSNVASLFTLHTERVRVAFAMVVSCFLISALNRVLMRANIFFIAIGPNQKLRIHKDIVTVLDIALTIAGIILTNACEPTADMLQAYLRDGCRVRRSDSVPFVNLAGLYVCAGITLFQHFVSIITVIVVGVVFNKNAEPKSAEEKEQEAQEEEARKEREEEMKEREKRERNANDDEQNENQEEKKKKKKDKKKNKKDKTKNEQQQQQQGNNNNSNRFTSPNRNFGGGGQYQYYPSNPNSAPASSRALVPSYNNNIKNNYY